MTYSHYQDDPGPGISRRAALRYLAGMAIGGSSGMLWLAGCGNNAAQTQSVPPVQVMPLSRALYTYRGHSGVINAVAWSPDGKRIASASEDKTVQVWIAERIMVAR